MLRARVYEFSAELPTIEQIVELLMLHTGEEITCDAEQDSDGVGAVLLSQAIESKILVECVAKEKLWLVLLVAMEKDAGRKYLTDSFQLVMESLGGIDEYAKEMPAAARQPWYLAKEWYQLPLDSAEPYLY